MKNPSKIDTKIDAKFDPKKINFLTDFGPILVPIWGPGSVRKFCFFSLFPFPAPPGPPGSILSPKMVQNDAKMTKK